MPATWTRGLLNPSVLQSVIFWDSTVSTAQNMELLGEEPLSIRVEGKPYSVIMRTPGEEIAHVAGFCLGEGIIDTAGGLHLDCLLRRGEHQRGHGDPDPRATGGRLPASWTGATTSARRAAGSAARSWSRTSTSCCAPCRRARPVGISAALAGLEAMSASSAAPGQDARLPRRRPLGRRRQAACRRRGHRPPQRPGQSHRQSACSKAASRRPPLLILSSRVSYELVQKAARARIPAILSVSRPTGLAVELCLPAQHGPRLPGTEKRGLCLLREGAVQIGFLI